ncbi:hypothetical protein [Acuticoccus sp.]|uniref:hypothetical protein n=1 Tax=Acuticoccus sp. TaxID=1904378 RepID=UPI003B519785
MAQEAADAPVAVGSQADHGDVDPALGPVFAELVELKRVRSAQLRGRSLADTGFRRAWSSLVGGADLEDVALTEVALAAAQVALGPVDGAALAEAGVAPSDRRTIYRRAAERTIGPSVGGLADRLDAVADGLAAPGEVPRFVELLCDQPRAGAVSEGAPRLVLTPEEMHSEHCWSVAVIAGLAEVRRGRLAGEAVLLGLAHHLPNAYLPDGGFAAERILDDHLAAMFERLTDRALADLPDELAGHVRSVLARRDDVDDPVGHAFNVADVVDRVLQQRHYANLAGFSLSDAMDARELVHPGPLQGFQYGVLQRLGLTF